MYIDTNSSKLYMMKTTGIYVSDKQNINWKILEGSENLPLDFFSWDRASLKNIFVYDSINLILAGTSKGIYKNNFITSFNDKKNKIPNYILSQNYPNPFNPSTVISYQLSVFSHATLKIYDMLGREVVVLVNKEQNAGYYRVEFNGSKLSSGVYTYVLRASSPTGETPDILVSKKMILLK